jgi:hypothetical protein
MTPQNLTHIKPGDKLALRNSSTWGATATTYAMLTVLRTTATQAVATYDGRPSSPELRIRLSDGRVIGKDYTRAVEATPYLLAQHSAETSMLKRRREAVKALETLIDKPMHRLNLTVEQMERLAAAWAEIKAMGSA